MSKKGSKGNLEILRLLLRDGSNRVADWVASHYKREMCIDGWLDRPPSPLVHILDKDRLPAAPSDR